MSTLNPIIEQPLRKESSNASSTGEFNILDHLHKLTPTGVKDTFECPVCGGKHLTINLNPNSRKYKAYTCWSGCTTKEVREAIVPWAERQNIANTNGHKNVPKSPKPKKRKPVRIPSGVKLLTLPEVPTDIPKPQPLTNKPSSEVPTTATETHYYYSSSQRATRFEWAEPKAEKGYKKTFRPYCLTINGKVELGKGNQSWPAYRLDEVLALLASVEGVPAVLWQEGETVVEIGRTQKIPSLTLQGSDWGVQDIKSNLVKIKNVRANAVQILLADPDTTGRKKAKDFSDSCLESNLPCLIVYPNDICSELKGDKCDLKQILQLITPQEFLRRLQAMLESAVELSDDEKLKLELLSLFQESDPIKKVRKRADICAHYRLQKSEVEELQRVLQKQTRTKEVRVYDAEEFLALESEGLQWIIPELLPKGETVILAGSPKAGKTLLGIDAAFCIATGEDYFLGQSVKRGKVLFVSCDESPQSTRSKLMKRGFRSQDKDFLRVLPSWTIDQLDLLEAQLEDFRPDVVLIDSLKRITHGSLVSENSAEFADNIYKLKELINKYGSAGILIHHTNKDLEQMGVGKIRGSSAIAGSVWGTWQLEHVPMPDPNNPKKLIIDPRDPKRVLSAFTRDCEGQRINIEFDPENNTYAKLDVEDQTESETTRERILKVLGLNPRGLSGRSIIECMDIDKETGRGVYTELNRMVNKRLISCHPHVGDKRVNIYCLPTSKDTSNFGGDSPPPPPCVSGVDYSAESITMHGLNNSQQNTQQLVNNYSTTFSKNHPVDYSNSLTATDTAILNNFREKGGERGSSRSTALSGDEFISLPGGEHVSREEGEKRMAFGDLDTPYYQQPCTSTLSQPSLFDAKSIATEMVRLLNKSDRHALRKLATELNASFKKDEVKKYLSPDQCEAIRKLIGSTPKTSEIEVKVPAVSPQPSDRVDEPSDTLPVITMPKMVDCNGNGIEVGLFVSPTRTCNPVFKGYDNPVCLIKSINVDDGTATATIYDLNNPKKVGKMDVTVRSKFYRVVPDEQLPQHLKPLRMEVGKPSEPIPHSPSQSPANSSINKHQEPKPGDVGTFVVKTRTWEIEITGEFCSSTFGHYCIKYPVASEYGHEFTSYFEMESILSFTPSVN